LCLFLPYLQGREIKLEAQKLVRRQHEIVAIISIKELAHNSNPNYWVKQEVWHGIIRLSQSNIETSLGMLFV